MGMIVTTTKAFNVELAKQTNKGALLILEAFRHDIIAKLKIHNTEHGTRELEWVISKIDSAIQTFTKTSEES